MSDSALVPTIYNNIQSETVLYIKGDEIQWPLMCTKAPSWSPAESRCCSSHAQIHWGYIPFQEMLTESHCKPMWLSTCKLSPGIHEAARKHWGVCKLGSSPQLMEDQNWRTSTLPAFRWEDWSLLLTVSQHFRWGWVLVGQNTPSIPGNTPMLHYLFFLRLFTK